MIRPSFLLFRSNSLISLGVLEEQIYTLAGHPFNINSPQQLAQILFEEQGLPHGRKTKTGFSTDVKVLEQLAKKHELPALHFALSYAYKTAYPPM